MAVKVVPDRVGADSEALARFEREAKAVAAVSHPIVLAIYDFGTDQGITYIVTELLEGESLRQRLQESSFPWRKAVEVGTFVADGLAAALAESPTITADYTRPGVALGTAAFEPRPNPNDFLRWTIEPSRALRARSPFVSGDLTAGLPSMARRPVVRVECGAGRRRKWKMAGR